MRILFATSIAVLLSAVFAPMTVRSADQPEFHWESGQYGTIRNGILTVTVPAGPEQEDMNCATAKIDLTNYRSRGAYTFSIQLRAREVSQPHHSWNGIKFMLHYKDETGKNYYHNVTGLAGTFDFREVYFTATIPETAKTGVLKLGLQESSGTAEFDLNSLKIVPLFPKTSNRYQIGYPLRIRQTPPLRGVMSPTRPMTKDDLATLKDWGVNLVRYQICRNWGKTNSDRDLTEYNRWLEGKLDHLEWLLSIAPEYGIRFVVDLHTPPGGRDNDSNLTMLFDRKYAEHFVKIWQHIAGRFKGNRSIWAYDLINEPVQNRPALCDYWNIQRLAAEAVRRIDPDTPIIIASNQWNSAAAYSYLPPLEMDNVIYQVHMYVPGEYTHQFVGNTFGEKGKQTLIRYPGMIGGSRWDKEALRKTLQPVRDFQLRHNARIYVGEFSAVAWAPGAADYLRDCIALFEEYGWDWSYHAFREWEGWSVEHEGTPGKLVPSRDNARRQILLEAFEKTR